MRSVAEIIVLMTVLFVMGYVLNEHLFAKKMPRSAGEGIAHEVCGSAD